MLKIDRATMALLGELADLRREDESAVVVAAFRTETFGGPGRLMDRHGTFREPRPVTPNEGRGAVRDAAGGVGPPHGRAAPLGLATAIRTETRRSEP